MHLCESEINAVMDLKEKIRASLQKYKCDDDFNCLPALPKASVLIPLLLEDGQVRLLFNVRSLNVRINAFDSFVI